MVEAHASIERTRKMLQSWPGATARGKTDATGEDAAQPDIDHALLQRMAADAKPRDGAGSNPVVKHVSDD